MRAFLGAVLVLAGCGGGSGAKPVAAQSGYRQAQCEAFSILF